MAIPYQLHLTFKVPDPRINAFVDACAKLGGKATLIVLPRGHFASHPMFTRTVHAEALSAARAAAAGYIQALSAQTGLTLRREKIEVPIEYAPEGVDFAENYFEWHGKLVYHDAEALEAVCERHGAHLSRNAVLGEETNRFVTLRDCSKTRFETRLAALTDALAFGGWKLLKSKKEFCAFDSHAPLDAGWLGDTGERLPEILACEAFICRAAQIGGPFMLKGSYVGRHYFPDVLQRLPGDMDWVCLERMNSAEEAHQLFGNWALAVTNLHLDDGVVFRSFSENAFWRYVDYAMADDFPTTSTDIRCHVGGRRVDITFDLSFNLAIPVPPVPLRFQSSRGDIFTVLKTVPLALQVAWKLHQTAVRARMKDFYDLAHFLIHPAFDAAARREALQALADECYADGTSPARLHHFAHGDWDKLFPKGNAEKVFRSWTLENLTAWNNHLPAERSPWVEGTPQDLAVFANFKRSVLKACRVAKLTELTPEDWLALKPSRVAWQKRR